MKNGEGRNSLLAASAVSLELMSLNWQSSWAVNKRSIAVAINNPNLARLTVSVAVKMSSFYSKCRESVAPTKCHVSCVKQVSAGGSKELATSANFLPVRANRAYQDTARDYNE